MSQLPDEVKQEVWSHLKATQVVYLATSEGDQPRVRPVTLLDLDQRFWIATGSQSAKVKEIERNPNIEFCLPLRDERGNGYIRVGGVASIVADIATKGTISRAIPFLQEHWTGPDDPDFCLLRVTRVDIEYLRPGASEALTFIV